MLVSYAPTAHNYRLATQNGFNGINRNAGASDGEIIEAFNMSADDYPLLATRKEGIMAGPVPADARKLYAFKVINGDSYCILYRKVEGEDFLYWIDLCRNFATVGRINPDNPVNMADIKTANIVGMGELICVYIGYGDSGEGYIYDSRAWEATDLTETSIDWIRDNPDDFEDYRKEGTIILTKDTEHSEYVNKYFIFSKSSWKSFTPFYPMSRSFSGGATFMDDTLYGAAAEANTIEITKPAWWTENNCLKVGDSVKVESESNNKTATILEIQELMGYMYLKFHENTWVKGSELTKISLEIPPMYHVFEHNNRLWGFEGRNIYCSALGEPCRWYTYTATADSAWAASINEGKLTGGYAYNYPIFMTENKIFTVLGTEPDNFTFSVTPSTFGCREGSWDSFAVVGEYLFYHSPWGFVRYAGGVPQLVSQRLDDEGQNYSNVHAGGAGVKYFATVEDLNGSARCFVYDALHGTWHEQTAVKDTSYATDGNTIYSATWHGVWAHTKDPAHEGEATEFDGEIPSRVVFAPYRFNSIRKKQIKSILIRHDVEGTLTMKLFEDGIENKSFSATLTGKNVTEITGVPERTDSFVLEFEGIGQWRIYAIAFEYIEGSAKP